MGNQADLRVNDYKGLCISPMQSHRIFSSYSRIWHLFLVNGTIVSRTYTETAMPLGKSGRGTATPARVVPILFDELLPEHVMLEALFMALIGGVGLSFMFDGGDDDPDEVVYDQENGLITGTDGDDTIVPTSEDGDLEDLIIDAGAGDDTVTTGGLYLSTVEGGDGDDTITTGYIDFSTVDGGDGDDTITASGIHGGTINGGLGNDTITTGGGGGEPVTINGGAGDDIIDAQSVANGDLNGGDGDDTIYMGPGGELATGQYLTVDGGAGDDTIIYDNSSADGDGGDRFFVSHPTVVNGGDGVDTFDITLYQGGGALGDDLYDEVDILSIADFEPDTETLQIDTIPEDGYEVTNATLTHSTDQTSLALTYAHPTEGEVVRYISIGSADVDQRMRPMATLVASSCSRLF